MPSRVVIADDSERFIMAARVLLEQDGMSVVGSATNSAECLHSVRELRPDLVLIDIMLGDESGFELARRLAEEHGEERFAIILVSTHSAADFAELIEVSPAAGFLSKSDLSAEAVRRMLHGT